MVSGKSESRFLGTGRLVYIASLIAFPVVLALMVSAEAGRFPPDWKEWAAVALWVAGVLFLNWPSRSRD